MSKSLLERLQQFGEKPGLERIQFLLNALGNPERAFPAVHVAGTNGKGSTSAMITSVLRAAGLRVGLFTSPHLVSYNERIVVDGSPISDEALHTLMGELEGLVQAAADTPGVGQPTEFEVATAAALVHFSRADVDVAVVEVGLGGRFDSTNVVRPIVSVITPIGLDHTNRLGTTLAEIAADKAGIMRSGVPIVSAPQAEEAADVIMAAAMEQRAPLLAAGRDFEATSVSVDARGTTFNVRWKDTWLRALRVPLLGAHQAVNGSVAAAACLTLREAAERDGLRTGLSKKIGGLSAAIIREGLQSVVWPGRMEVVGTDPTVMLDGAHNAEAASVLASTLRTVFPDRRPVFVMAISGDKPVDTILQTLLPLGKAVVFTAPRSSRTPPVDPAELARRAAGLVETITVEPMAERAVARARALGDLVVVCGSLYLVGEVRGFLAGDSPFERE